MYRAPSLEIIPEESKDKPEPDNDRGEYLTPIRKKKAVQIHRGVKERVEQQAQRRKEQKLKLKEEKLIEIESQRKDLRLKINNLCKKQQANHPQLDDGNQLIGYRLYTREQTDIPWRVGRIQKDPLLEEYEYKSKWLSLINQALYSPSLEELDTVGYYASLSIQPKQEGVPSITEDMECMFFKVKEDIEIDEKVLPGIHDVISMDKYELSEIDD